MQAGARQWGRSARANACVGRSTEAQAQSNDASIDSHRPAVRSKCAYRRNRNAHTRRNARSIVKEYSDKKIEEGVMRDFRSWNVICGANSAPTVLGVDFPSAAGRCAGFAELAALIGPDYRFLQANPPSGDSIRGLSGAAYTRACIEEIEQDGGAVLAVLGRGIGGVYAAAIAEGIARWQEVPAIILFDPELATAELLSQTLNREIAANMSILSAAEIRRGRELEAKIAMDRHDGLAAIAADLIEDYLEVITAPYERAGLGDPRGHKHTVPFASYISLISAADQIDPRHGWRDSTAIVSSDYSKLPEKDLPSGEQSRLIGTRISFDIDHSDLLRSDCVVGEVLDLLTAREF
jgi:hypothetical protein